MSFTQFIENIMTVFLYTEMKVYCELKHSDIEPLIKEIFPVYLNTKYCK